MSTQLDLFGEQEAHKADLAAKRNPRLHAEEGRVRGVIAPGLIAYRLSIGVGVEFTMEQATDKLRENGIKVENDSARKILSTLRKDGVLHYERVRRGVWRFTK